MCGCEASVCSWLKFPLLQKCATDADLYRPEACACGLHETENGGMNSSSVLMFLTQPLKHPVSKTSWEMMVNESIWTVCTCVHRNSPSVWENPSAVTFHWISTPRKARTGHTPRMTQVNQHTGFFGATCKYNSVVSLWNSWQWAWHT